MEPNSISIGDNEPTDQSTGLVEENEGDKSCTSKPHISESSTCKLHLPVDRSIIFSSLKKSRHHRRSRTKPQQPLPIGSVAQIIGNDRVNPRLVNQRGTVLRIATLGGWHELRMDNGEIRKVQRNGLKLVLQNTPAPRHGIISRFSDLSLSKYARFYGIHINSNRPIQASRSEVEKAIASHFTDFQVDEAQVISEFTKYIRDR